MLTQTASGGGQIVNYAFLYEPREGNILSKWAQGSRPSGGTMSYGTYITIVSPSYSSSLRGSRWIVTIDPFNLSEYVSIGTVGYSYTSGGRCDLGIATAKLTGDTTSFAPAGYTEMARNETTSREVLMGDVSNKTGQWYVYFIGVSPYSKTAGAKCYGIFLVKQDNWQGLCAKAGIDASAYTDEAALCADVSAMGAILGNSSAVSYMVANCTGSFMAAFIASSTALSAYSASAYKSVIDNNEHWAKFLSMLQ